MIIIPESLRIDEKNPFKPSFQNKQSFKVQKDLQQANANQISQIISLPSSPV